MQVAEPVNNIGIRRARLFIRDCGRASGDWRSGSKAEGHAYALVGVAEIDDRAGWKREMYHDFASMITPFGGMLSFEGAPRPTEPYHAQSDLSSTTDHEFRNAGEIHRAMGWSAGGLILRDTRMPTTPGTTIVSVMGCICAPAGTLPDAHMATLVVDPRPGDETRPGRGRLRIEGPCPIPTNGMSLSQVHKSTLWGWGPELRGFRSLMRLDVVDAATRLQQLLVSEDPDPEDVAKLKKITGSCVTESDPMFVEFRKRITARGALMPWDATPTQAEDDAHEAVVRDVLRDLMAEDLAA